MNYSMIQLPDLGIELFKKNPPAEPYLKAMLSLDSIDDSYGYDGTKNSFQSKFYPWINLNLQIKENDLIVLTINNKDYQYIPIFEKENDISTCSDKIFIHYKKEGDVDDLENYILISPEEVESVEKVARKIRVEIFKELLEVYPQKIDFYQHELEQELSNIDGIKILKEGNKKKIFIMNQINEKELSPIFRKAMKQLNSYGKQKERDIENLKQLEDSIRNDSGKVKDFIYHCINCDETKNINFIERDSNCFYFTCDSCMCEWGIELKDGCRVPFFHVKNYKEKESSFENLGMDFI